MPFATDAYAPDAMMVCTTIEENEHHHDVTGSALTCSPASKHGKQLALTVYGPYRLTSN
jgi:hypothetical protein